MLMLSSLLVHRRLFLRDRDRTACDNTDCVATHSAADGARAVASNAAARAGYIINYGGRDVRMRREPAA